MVMIMFIKLVVFYGISFCPQVFEKHGNPACSGLTHATYGLVSGPMNLRV